MGTKSPAVRRIMREAAEFASQPSSDFTASPIESDLFEWHFTLRGPPAPSPFEGGIYHGRIVLPPAYPLKPPSFRFLTATGRFEVNREICLSISGHHEESWQPAWGIRTALVAIRSFMDTGAAGQLGGLDTSEEVRRRFAKASGVAKCATCGKTNEEIMKEQEELVKSVLGDEKGEEEVLPEELRLAYREDLGKGKASEPGAPPKASTEKNMSTNGAVISSPSAELQQRVLSQPAPATSSAVATNNAQAMIQAAPQSATAAPRAQQRRPQAAAVHDPLLPYLDKAIYVVLAAIIILLYKKIVL